MAGEQVFGLTGQDRSISQKPFERQSHSFSLHGSQPCRGPDGNRDAARDGPTSAAALKSLAAGGKGPLANGTITIIVSPCADEDGNENDRADKGHGDRKNEKD